MHAGGATLAKGCHTSLGDSPAWASDMYAKGDNMSTLGEPNVTLFKTAP